MHTESTLFLTRIDTQRNRALAVSFIHRQDIPLFAAPAVLREKGRIPDLHADFSVLYAPLPAEELSTRKAKDLMHLIENLGTEGLSETVRRMTPLSVDDLIAALEKIRWSYLYPGLPMGIPEGDVRNFDFILTFGN